MHFKVIGPAALVGMFLLAPAAVEAACCDQQGHHAVEPSAVELLLSMDPQINPAPPVRQAAEVWLQRPTLVGQAILQGRYVIEHDHDRMARGEPCSHLYAFNDRVAPVAAFHCTHLERERASRNVVVLVNTSDSSLQKLKEFQFAGESFSHGYPTGH